MRTIKTLSVITAVLVMGVSLTGCQLLEDAIETVGTSADQAVEESTTVAPSEGRTATVARVIDGDTIAVVPNEHFEANYNCYKGTCKEHAIRMLGIDTPEMNKNSSEPAECGAEDALINLKEMLPEGSQITVMSDPKADASDRYGRTLGYVLLPHGSDAGLLMTLDGYAAAWYPSGEPEPVNYAAYLDAEQTAQAAGSGSWATCTNGIGASRSPETAPDTAHQSG